MSKKKQVILIERVGRLQSFNLPHEQYCNARGVCSCKVKTLVMRELDKRTGKAVPRPVQRRTSNSFTLLPREKKVMDAAVLQCDDVEGARKARLILVRHV